MRRFADDFLASRFERVPGVASSNVVGGREDEMQVIVDPELLARSGLTIDSLRQALIRQNIDVAAGDLWEGKKRIVVRTLGRIRRVGWRREQVLDIAFNVTIALVGFATVGLAWYFVDASGLSALGGGSMSVFGAQISGVARSVAPSVPGYLAAAALMGGVLLAWWWAER